MSDRTAHEQLRASLVEAAHGGPARRELREQLVAAAHRELAPVRRRRRRWRVGAAVAVALLGATAAAEATGLISIGRPLQEQPGIEAADPRYAVSQPAGVKLVETADDPGAGARWGVGVYRSPAGRRCAIAGQLRGFSLGLVVDGRFRPYGDRRRGACLSNARMKVVWDLLVVPGTAPRTVLFGVARPGARRVVVSERGERHQHPLGPEGAFLFVFEGVLGYDELRGEVE